MVTVSQTPDEYNQAFRAGYEHGIDEMSERDYVDAFRDEVQEPKSVPLKDVTGHIIGRVQIDVGTGLLTGSISDPAVAEILKGQFGAGLRSISFESMHYHAEQNNRNQE